MVLSKHPHKKKHKILALLDLNTVCCTAAPSAVPVGGGGGRLLIRKLECGSLCVMWLLAEMCQPQAHRHHHTTTNQHSCARSSAQVVKVEPCTWTCMPSRAHTHTYIYIHNIPLSPALPWRLGYLIFVSSSGTRVNSFTRSTVRRGVDNKTAKKDSERVADHRPMCGYGGWNHSGLG